MLWPTILTLLALPLLVGLGIWQLERLEWKRALIERIETRTTQPPIPFPSPPDWTVLDPEALDYRPVTVIGRFDHARELHWFGQNEEGAAGYHIITPLTLEDGGYVFVDRGFVPIDLKAPQARAQGQVEGWVTVTGLARRAATRGHLDVADDPQNNVWFVRDIAAMSAAAGVAPVAPVFVAADATPNPGGWPKGGATRVELRNTHLQYAVTWFGLAAVLIVVYLAYHRVQGRLGRR